MDRFSEFHEICEYVGDVFIFRGEGGIEYRQRRHAQSERKENANANPMFIHVRFDALLSVGKFSLFLALSAQLAGWQLIYLSCSAIPVSPINPSQKPTNYPPTEVHMDA